MEEGMKETGKCVSWRKICNDAGLANRWLPAERLNDVLHQRFGADRDRWFGYSCHSRTLLRESKAPNPLHSWCSVVSVIGVWPNRNA